MDERPSIGSPKWKEEKSVGMPTLDLNSRTQEVYFGGKSEHLTQMEFQVLWLLNRANGGIVSRNEIDEFIYDDEEMDSPLGNSIEIFINRIRKKIEGSGYKIVANRGLGYKLEKDED